MSSRQQRRDRYEEELIKEERERKSGRSKRPTKQINRSSSQEGEAEGHRRVRLEHIITEELNFLIRDETEDPALEGVHVVSVELSPDYRLAKAMYQIEEDYSLDEVQSALERSASYLKGLLADTLDMKFVPSLRFMPALG